MRYLSVCSGIEAASASWQPLGWTPVAFSEIEPFPCSVLAHHHPAVPNWGDMTKFEEWPDEPIDLLCGGTPCQSFSVAGLRKGLADPRGNLMLTFGAIAAKYRPRWLVWENVPGVLSSNGGRDFGAFLGLLAELGYGFAYRVLDAQYVRVESHPRAVPQRRRRVFVVGHSGGQWQRAAAVLFERESLRGHPAPRREAGEGITQDTAPCLTSSGRGVERTGDTRGQDPVVAVAFGGNNQTGPIDVATARNACASASGRMDFESETFLVQPTHTLRGEGFDASEDGTGRGTPLVPVGVTIHGTDPTVQKVASLDETAQCLRARTPGNIDNSSTTVVMQPVAFAENTRAEVRLEGGDGTRTGALSTGGGKPGQGIPCVAYGIRTANTSSNRWGIQEEVTHTLDCAQGVAVAQPASFAIQAGALRTNPLSGPDGIGVQADHAYTLEARAEVQAVAFQERGRTDGRSLEVGGDIAYALTAPNGGGRAQERNVLTPAMQVRRLTPVECERLQGFPDGYTAIPWRKKPASECPDGPRYKSLGNSWAVNCARWIGERIEAVETIVADQAELETA